MKALRLVRWAALAFAVLALLGGYAAHQYFLFQGADAFARWSEGIARPNLVLGWVLLIVGVVLCFVNDEEELP